MEKTKQPLSTFRLVAGIITIVLSVLVTFQSCAAGLSNALEENGESGGSAGVFTDQTCAENRNRSKSYRVNTVIPPTQPDGLIFYRCFI